MSKIARFPRGCIHPKDKGIERFMPSVRVRDNEPFEFALRRFRRSCEKAGLFTEMRRREFYEKPTSVRKRKAAAARKRELKKLSRERQFRSKRPF